MMDRFQSNNFSLLIFQRAIYALTKESSEVFKLMFNLESINFISILVSFSFLRK